MLADWRINGQRLVLERRWHRTTHRASVPLRTRREALRAAGADLVRDAVAVARVAHLDDGLDLVQSGGAESRARLRVALVGVWAAAEGVVGDLRALRVADDDELRVRAARVEGVDSGGDGGDAGADGRVVGCAAAGGLAAAGGRSGLVGWGGMEEGRLPCWVGDCFGG